MLEMLESSVQTSEFRNARNAHTSKKEKHPLPLCKRQVALPP